MLVVHAAPVSGYEEKYMRIFTVLFMGICLTAGANPCTNGSFEEVDAAGVAVDWQPMGQVTVIDSDAHTGKRCLRIVRTGREDYPESGLNRAWVGKNGKRGAMLAETRGGMEFWYKVPSADAKKISLLVIPMNAEPLEEVGSQRRAFDIPDDHKGDGRWHRGRLKYDYTGDPKVKWVHFAARLLEPGEVLLDDFAYLEHVGPMPAIEKVRLEESADAPGERAVLHATVTNRGDLPAPGVLVALTSDLPGLQAALGDTVRALGTMAPGYYQELSWPINYRRVKAGALLLTATWETGKALPAPDSPDYPATTLQFPLERKLTLINWGPEAPVAAVGQPIGIEAWVENTGNTLLPASLTMTYTLGGMMTTATLDKALPPGGKAVIRGTSVYGQQSPAVSVVLNGIHAGDLVVEGGQVSTLVVGADCFVPLEELAEKATRDQPYAVKTEDYVACVTPNRALVFRRNNFGYGPGEILVRTDVGWKTWLWMPRLSTIVVHDEDGVRQVFVPQANDVRMTFPGSEGEVELGFKAAFQADKGPKHAFELSLALRSESGRVSLDGRFSLVSDRESALLRLDGPMFYMADRTEAIVPGLEWLVDDEVSSSTLDIQEGHPHQVRYVPDPRMCTMPALGLKNSLGTVIFRWREASYSADGTPPTGRCQPVFASPDRFENQRSHLFGIQLPSVPEHLDPNSREAARPLELTPNVPVAGAWRLEEGRYPEHLAASMAAPYLARKKAASSPVTPAPLPRGSYDGEIQFSMRAFFDSLWEPEENMWMLSKNGPPQMSHLARDPNYVADILVGALHSPDKAVRARCRALVEEHAGLLHRRPTLETLRFGVRPDRAVSLVDTVGGLLATRGEDGLWHFDADRKDTGVFRGMDYHVIGEDGAVAVGNNADKVRSILRYARVAGDWRAYEAMVPVLEYFQTRRVPRAAQVWEVPFHTPDLLAASDAVECFLEAYRFSGEQRWLDAARDWAFKGLPFIYFWQNPEKPYTLGGSIPVFGATWFSWSWFARPVQWNGLRYADALLMLDEEDSEYDWRPISETIIRCVFYQQATEGEDVALWPDSISVIDGEKSGWVFGPRMPITSIMALRGESEVVRTTILGEGRDRIHVSALASIEDAAWQDGQVRFNTAFPEGYAGFVLLSNVTRPVGVTVNGHGLTERNHLFQQDAPGWFYDDSQAFLSLQLGVGDRFEVTVNGVDFQPVSRLPEATNRIDFTFDQPGFDGWTPANDMTNLHVVKGALTGDITGGDPYMYRTMLDVSGDSYQAIEVRMHVPGGGMGQLYWNTADDSAINEAKVFVFPVQGDGAFHVYRIQTAGHPAWDGQTILSLRLDPCNGGTGPFAVDYIRGVTP